MVQPKLLCLTYFLAFLALSSSAKVKVRYSKARDRNREVQDIFSFLGLIGSGVQPPSDDAMSFFQPTPPATTTSTTTTAPRTVEQKKSLKDYCLKTRGQFRYTPDCHKFVDCWDSSVVLKDCHPRELVFEPETSSCVWDWDPKVKGLCEGETKETAEKAVEVLPVKETNFELPFCSDFEHLGYTCVQEYRCRDGVITEIKDINIFEVVLDVRGGFSYDTTDDISGSQGKFRPWTKICPLNQDRQVCCKDPNHVDKFIATSKKVKNSRKAVRKTLCPMDYTGLQPFPTDCKKFVNCWKGTGTVQSCAPGTEFNANLGQCDFPHKANCKPSLSSVMSGKPAVVISDSSGSDDDVELSLLARSSGLDGPSVFPSPPSGQTVRLRGGVGPHKGYLEIFHQGEWGYVCDDGQWTFAEADLVCKQLGFTRGVKKTAQGLLYGPVNEDRQMTNKVDCNGFETGIEKCVIDYASGPSLTGRICKLSEGIVAISCHTDSLASCPAGEIPWGGSCYSLHFNRSTFMEAQNECKRNGKMLAEITNQQENDLISELLLQSQLSPGLLAEVWTGGIGDGRARAPKLYWHGSRDQIGLFRPFWPGWNGEKKGQFDIEGYATQAVKMSRKFEFVTRRTREQRLTDYYFWNLENLKARLAFICEGPQKDIGCIEGNGEDYRGSANRGESGVTCLKWDSPQLSFVVDKDEIPNLGPLEGNNFCRNPDGDTAPWCIAPNGEFDYCDIPKCKDEEEVEVFGDVVSQNKVDEVVFGSRVKCKADQFQCGNQCILSAYVCDGITDCDNGRDEDSCTKRELEKFEKRDRQRLNVNYIERWLDTTLEACAAHCIRANDFKCRSFNYQAARKLCTLNEVNLGMTGKLVSDSQWDYFELRRESTTCNERLRCPNGKCLSELELCDGKDDCGDRHDEVGCSVNANMRIKLSGGKTMNEGRVEIAAFNYPYGGICDDGFSLAEANVICRQLGYQNGAKEALIDSHFGHGQGSILLDELVCKGNETTLLDCQFAPWTKHDCSDHEWAGVICHDNNNRLNCNPDEEWQCSSGECIALSKICDQTWDCRDGSDESDFILCDQPFKVRLADGNNATSGRIEVRYKGVWGTICDDNFGPEEGKVACRMLGFEGRAIIHSEAAFKPGSGPIWMQNVVCQGHEQSLNECNVPSWVPTRQCKHIEDVGVECVPVKTTGTKTTSQRGIGGEACGVPQVEASPSVPVARIAGGLQSRPGANPWAASVRLQGTSKSFHWCGAIVISEFFVLSVAHCMEDYPRDVYRIRVGDWDMQVPDLQEQEFRVSAVYFHEQYNVGLYLNNDIALIKLEADKHGRGIRFGERIVPACLPFETVMYGTHLNCSVTGWGSTGISKPGYTRFLQSAKMPILPTQSCTSRTVYGPDKLGTSMFCAGYLEGGIDTCQGDSGGGLVCDIRGKQTVLGLTSWGYGCGRPNRPGVYTKVADYLDWIQEHINST